MTDKPHKLGEKLSSTFSQLFYISLGIFLFIPTFIFFILLTIPATIYRSFVILLLKAPCLRRRLGFEHLLTRNFGVAFALEYLQSVATGQGTARGAILSSTVFEGTISYPDCVEKVTSGWIQAKLKDKLQYPELQCFVDSWMGYPYWRKDDHFALSNHMRHHVVSENVDLEGYTVQLYEDLYNVPFRRGRSPWEMHVVHGWRPVSTDNPEKVAATVFVLKMHHVIGDGLSIMSAVVQGIVRRRLTDLQVASPALIEAQQRQLLKERKETFLQRFRKAVKQSVRFLYDLGIIMSFYHWRASSRTRFHIRRRSHSGKLFYARSRHIPMDKVKKIGRHFGVRFTSVLISAVATGVSQYLREGDSRKNFIMSAPRPLPGHSLEKLVNHLSGSAYKLPVAEKLDPVTRLRKSDGTFRSVNNSHFVYILPLLAPITATHPMPIARYYFRNRTFGVNMTNIPGPQVPVKMKGSENRGLGVEAAFGTYDGVSGLTLLIISYDTHFTINAVAEEACMSKPELLDFMEIVQHEIDYLHELTFQRSNHNCAESQSGSPDEAAHVVVPLMEHGEFNLPTNHS